MPEEDSGREAEAQRLWQRRLRRRLLRLRRRWRQRRRQSVAPERARGARLLYLVRDQREEHGIRGAPH